MLNDADAGEEHEPHSEADTQALGEEDVRIRLGDGKHEQAEDLED